MLDLMLTWLSKKSKVPPTKKTRWFPLLVLIIIPLTIWGRDVYQDRKLSVHIDAETPLYATRDDAERGAINQISIRKAGEPLKAAKQVMVLHPGDQLRVKRMRYGKDFTMFKVETKDGTIGWVAHGQTGITIIGPSVRAMAGDGTGYA